MHELLSRQQFEACIPTATDRIVGTFYTPLNIAMKEFKINTPYRIAAFIAQIAHESNNLSCLRGGLIQLSDKGNYNAAGKALGYDLINDPLLVETPKAACRIAAWFWDTHGCNDFADVGMFGAITRRINGGYDGATQRLKNYAMCKKALGIA